ncbi:MAG: hypothetical protein IJV00_09285 [Clostridia bacterium]|nr:hypothetical protein [Clostridia bacterium]
MLFQKRLDRAREVQRRLRGLDDEAEKKESVSEEDPLYPTETDVAVESESEEPAEKRRFFKRKKRKKADQGLETEKGDIPAMMLSALYTLVLPAAGILIVFVLLTMLLFRLF